MSVGKNSLSRVSMAVNANPSDETVKELVAPVEEKTAQKKTQAKKSSPKTQQKKPAAKSAPKTAPKAESAKKPLTKAKKKENNPNDFVAFEYVFNQIHVIL